MRYFYVLLCCFLITGCATPEKKDIKPKEVPKEKVNWKKINEDVKQKTRKVKGDDFDDLVNWVVSEVHEKVPKHEDWQGVNDEVLNSYHYEKKDKEYDELIIWVIDEVKEKIKSDKYILEK